ncbi:MAG: Ig-like domain-containing protein [Bacteroidales bacterium]|nr:Ig-like domain-containing protein [Bacteroidales bacterium]
MIPRMPKTGLILFIISTILFAACAKQGMPSGGPKDVTPPTWQRSLPENRSLNFSENSFFIEFDEYVVIKDADNNIIVSPPLKNKPQYSTKGHGIRVKINDTLQPGTTYLFQFKNAIADYNEGNLLPSLEYVFSTGSFIDSMTLRGTALDALTLQSRKEPVSVWLLTKEQYESILRSREDTTIGKVTPSYITRCDKEGKFSFNYIRPGKYYVIAVEDANNDLMVGTSEAVGFTSDALNAVSITDSTEIDSLKVSTADLEPLNIKIFEPQNQVQRITSGEFKASGRIQLTTLLPMQDPVVRCDEDIIWHLNSQRDTITVWTRNEKCDSLHLVVGDVTGLQDTLRLRWRSKKNNEASKTLPVHLNYGSLPYFETLRLICGNPIDSLKTKSDSMVCVMSLKDSVTHFCGITIDSTMLSAQIMFDFAQGEKYTVFIAKGCIHDIYGNGNDSIKATVAVTGAEQYGSMKITIKGDSTVGSTPVIVELLNEKGVIITSKNAKNGDAVEFRNLKPAKYRVRVIIDENADGKWSAGDMYRCKQPEKVFIHKKTFDIRANWDFEEIWEINGDANQ